MKAKFVCFKLSVPICVLVLVIILEVGFIVFQINELCTVRKFQTNTKRY